MRRSRILQGAREALAYVNGEADVSTYRIHVPEEIDVKAIRMKTGLSQAAFAARYSFTTSQVQSWEQGRFKPTGAARAYLLVIDREPAAVKRALKVA